MRSPEYQGSDTLTLYSGVLDAEVWGTPGLLLGEKGLGYVPAPRASPGRGSGVGPFRQGSGLGSHSCPSPRVGPWTEPRQAAQAGPRPDSFAASE